MQNLQLAHDYLQAAQAVKLSADQARALEDRAALTPLILAVLKASAESPGDLDKDAFEKKKVALEQLRAALLGFRGNLAQNAQRDHLELLMFGARVLVEESLSADRFHLLEDSELLLGFCRRALQNRNGATGASLRQYYDTVIAAKTRVEPRHVKDLLETVYEATRGEVYPKPITPRPVLALYVLNGRTHLFLDAPRALGGVSKHFLLGAEYTPERLRAAVEDPSNRLTLPGEVRQELDKLKEVAEGNPERVGESVVLELWWEDPLIKLTYPPAKGERVVKADVAEGFTLFPFKLPGGIRKVDMPPQSSQQSPAVVQVKKP